MLLESKNENTQITALNKKGREIQMWEPLPEEPEAIYRLFKIYIELGRYRTYKDVALISGKSLRTIERIASKWKWQNRINALNHYITNNYELGIIDYCNELENQKFHLQLDIALVSKEISQNLKVWINNFECIYSNPEVLKKLKFLKELATTAKKFYSLIDFKLNPEYYLAKFKKDLLKTDKSPQKINVDPDFDITKIMEKENFLEMFSQMIKEKNQKIADNIAIGLLFEPPIGQVEPSEDPVLKAIYSEPVPGDYTAREEYEMRSSPD